MRFHGRQLGGLRGMQDLGVHMTLGDFENGEDERPYGGHAKRLGEQADLVLANEVPRRNAKHEEAGQDVSAA